MNQPLEAARRAWSGGQDRSMDGKDAAFFMRRLQLLFGSSVPILKSLETLEQQEEDPYWSQALRLATRRLEGGAPLSAALSASPAVISPQSAQLVKLGESSGRLDVVLRELANALERSSELARRFRSALALPIFQAVFSMLLLGLLVSTMLPPMLELSQQIGGDLGPLVKGCLSLARMALNPWTLFGAAQLLLALSFLLRRWLASSQGRLIFDGLLLRAPVLGPLLTDQATFTFAQGMRLLLACGSNMVPALKTVSETVTNTVMRAEIQAAAGRVLDGSSLAGALREATRFDPLFVSVVAVGEETGSLHDLLGRMCAFFQTRVEDRLDMLVSLLEPLILCMVGGVVTLLSLLFFLPIVRVVQAL